MTERAKRVMAACSAAAVLMATATSPLSARHETVAGSVTLTVDYKGKGTVDETHKLWIWVFDTPNIGPGAMPIREESVTTNGGKVTVSGLGEERVWIAVGYDERGGSAGNAPPASGSPIGIYSATGGTPTGLTTADNAAAVVTSDDSLRMP